MVLTKSILLDCSFYLRPFQWEWFVSADQLECKQALGFAHSNFEAQTYNHKRALEYRKKCHWNEFKEKVNFETLEAEYLILSIQFRDCISQTMVFVNIMATKSIRSQYRTEQ